jgi:hypothetical protein
MFPKCNVIKEYEVQLYKGKYNLILFFLNKPKLINYFKAIKWVEMNSQYVCPCSTISTVKNILHILQGVESKSHFVVCLINGLGANFNSSQRDKFSKMVKHLYR